MKNIKKIFRKRGVSIENVMLGLVVVLIFGGLLYGAFSMANRKIQANEVQREMRTISMELKRLRSTMGLMPFWTMTYDYQNLERYLYDSGIMTEPTRVNGQMNYPLPYQGQFAFEPNFQGQYLMMNVNFWAGNSRSVRSLCHAIAGAQALARTQSEENDLMNNTMDPDTLAFTGLEFNSGPLGESYVVVTNGCDADFRVIPSFTVIYDLR